MAATAWALYNTAKKYLQNGTIVIGTSTLKLKLYTSASNAETLTITAMSEITNESAGGGYANGKTLGGVELTSVLSAKSFSFDASDVVFTASGSTLANVKYAVIGISGGKALCWTKLTTAQFSVTSPNTLTITMHASGIYEMH